MAPAILRPCTPLYAHVRPVRPQITPSTPSTPMGVHGRTLYAHKKFVRPHNCTPMGVHGRTCTPTKKSQQFFVGVQCTPMYAHVHPCTPMDVRLYGRTNFLWAYNVRPCTPMKKNVYAHKKFTNKQNLVKVQAKWLKVVSRILN